MNDTTRANLTLLIERFLYKQKWVKVAKGIRIIRNDQSLAEPFEEQQIDLVKLLFDFINSSAASGVMTITPSGPTTTSISPVSPAATTAQDGSLELSSDPSTWTENQLDQVLDAAKAAHKGIVEDIKAMIQEKSLHKKKCLVCGKRPLVQVGIGPTTDQATWFYETGKQGPGYYHPNCYTRGKVLAFEGRQG